MSVYDKREDLVEAVKNLGELIIEKADDIVGDWDAVHTYTITGKITCDEIPQLYWTKVAHAIPVERKEA